MDGMWYLTTNPDAFIVVNIQTGQRHIMWQNGGLSADKLAKPGDVPKFDPPLELQDNGMAQVDKNWYLYVDGNITGVIHNTTKVRHMFCPRQHQNGDAAVRLEKCRRICLRQSRDPLRSLLRPPQNRDGPAWIQ
jgi:hypothetical protein